MKWWQVQEKNFYSFSVLFLPAIWAFIAVPLHRIPALQENVPLFTLLVLSLFVYHLYFILAVVAALVLRKLRENQRRMIVLISPIVMSIIFEIILGAKGFAGIGWDAFQVGCFNVIAFIALLILLKKITVVVPDIQRVTV